MALTRRLPPDRRCKPSFGIDLIYMNPMADQTSPQRAASIRRLVPLGLLVAVWVAFMLAGGYRYLTLPALAEHRDWLSGLVQRWGLVAAIFYIAVYGLLVALSA